MNSREKVSLIVMKFMAEIKKHEGIDGAYVEIPFDVEAAFGSKRVKVKATFDSAAYRGSIVNMGGCFMIGMTQAIRKEIGKQPGDIIEVTVEKDEEERIIEMPEDFLVILTQNREAKTFYETLSFTNKKDYVKWITDAKREETRNSRVQKAVQLLSDKKKLK
jgi:bifunctional DNA-binding transcriptional regulator/antitoxin component of YhaV-PrlF toxin-antitoxin module